MTTSGHAGADPGAGDPTPVATDAALLVDALRGTLDSAALGALTTTVAHGGNNRLTVILACLDLLRAADVGDSDLQSAIGLATGAAQQLAGDFAALLAGARREAARVASVDVADAVRRASRVDALLHASLLDLQWQVEPGLRVAIERDRLEATLLRLFMLARRLGAAALTLQGRGHEIAARSVDRPSLRKGRYCCLEITLPGVTLPDPLLQPTAEPAHVLGRLEHPDGLEFAAIEAVAGSSRGQLLASHRDAGATLELFLPASSPRG